MAIVSDGFFGSISVADQDRQISTLSYELTGVDFITAAADMVTILAALEAVIDGEVIRYRVGQKFKEGAIVLPPGVHIQDKASLTVSLVNDVDLANIKIPAPTIGIFTGATGKGASMVDISDAAVLAYVALFGAAGQATVSDGQVADALLSGKRIHAKSNFG